MNRIHADNTVNTLVDPQAIGYAGDVIPSQTYDYLTAHEDAMLVDVRTQPEWQFVGVPELPGHHKPQYISWKIYPQMQENPEFATQLATAVVNKHTPVFFLCRSGGRSLDAAIFATKLGYRCCFNITGGFEGEPDASGKRSTKEGWKASELPWSQT